MQREVGHKAHRLLQDEREFVLSKAVTAIPPAEAERAEEFDVEANGFFMKILDYLSADGDRATSTLSSELSDIARQFSEGSIPWAVMSGLYDALARSLSEYAAGIGDRILAEKLYAGLLKAQARLFEAYTAAEAEKKERITRYQWEIDRFPDTIAATLDPPTLTKVGLGRLKDILGMDTAVFFTLDHERNMVPAAGDISPTSGEKMIGRLQGKAENTLLERGAPYWEVAGCADSCLEALREGYGTGSVLLLPVVVRGRVTGMIMLADGPDRKRFDPEEVDLAGRFVSRLAVALENARLHAREQRKIKETVALLEITRAINSTLDLREILEKVVQMTVDLCGVRLCVVYLLEEETSRFVPAAHYGFIEDGLWEDERVYGFDITELGARPRRALEGGDPVPVTSDDAGCLLQPDLAYEHGVDLVFMYPLNAKEVLTGVLALFYPQPSCEELESDEVEVVKAIAAQASMAIENAALYEDIERSYFSTVKALAKAIEVKDPYTHGHSERVTEYALLIADFMKLDERDKQKLKYAATLHDIGKIGIAGRVLNKPGALTEEEYTHVKTHPLLGDSIIEPVEFLQGPRPIILHHHEHFDGSGYPQGLGGKGIPLCARILSVADAFEAMRSDRPYRKALPLLAAMQELRRNAGSQFDPEVVEAFLSIIEIHGGDPVKR
jgi:HD-GYP domain-containing protein (c-di-GMP phosphodiesterase class II)